ncbi:MAG: BspA family leucine-rich repeat surface protein [Gammaproteobacteria bacterium]|nr:BspA family leucine-rich repeat surface protein [Gammaproteobacteria bacterium]
MPQAINYNGLEHMEIRAGLSEVPAFQFGIQTAIEDDSFTLPIYNGGNYSFDVDWGDGNSDTITAWDDAAKTHTYEDSGPTAYTIKITGTIAGFRFNNGGDKLLMRDVQFWGPIEFLGNAWFFGCTGLTVSATDAPTITTTSMIRILQGTNVSTIPGLGSWPTGNVTAWDFAFAATNFNEPTITNLDMSSAVTLARLTKAAINFNQAFPAIPSTVTSVREMAEATSFAQSISNWDIDSLSNGTEAFNATDMGTSNMDASLISFDGQPHIIAAVPFHFGNAKYTGGGAAEAAFDGLVADGWVISSGGVA